MHGCPRKIGSVVLRRANHRDPVIRSWIRVCSRSFAVCYRVGDVFLGDDAYRLAGVRVQDHEGARVLHNAGGCGRVVVLVCRREWWPHDVRDDGRGG
jgi:hypothetical protein